MNKYITKGNVAATLAIAAMIVGAFGKHALAVFLNDPTTTQNILLAFSALSSLVAGALPGIKQ